MTRMAESHEYQEVDTRLFTAEHAEIFNSQSASKKLNSINHQDTKTQSNI